MLKNALKVLTKRVSFASAKEEFTIDKASFSTLLGEYFYERQLGHYDKLVLLKERIAALADNGSEEAEQALRVIEDFRTFEAIAKGWPIEIAD